jgi:hypothetical protein
VLASLAPPAQKAKSHEAVAQGQGGGRHRDRQVGQGDFVKINLRAPTDEANLQGLTQGVPGHCVINQVDRAPFPWINIGISKGQESPPLCGCRTKLTSRIPAWSVLSRRDIRVISREPFTPTSKGS